MKKKGKGSNKKGNGASKLSKERKLLILHAKVMGIEVLVNESDNDLQARILASMDGLSDDAWDKIPKDTREWSDQFFEEEPPDEEEGEEEVAGTQEEVEEKKAVYEAKTKAKTKAAETTKKGNEWKEGSIAQQAFNILKGAGADGISLAEAVKAAKKAKIKVTGDLELFLKIRFNDACRRGLATKEVTKDKKHYWAK